MVVVVHCRTFPSEGDDCLDKSPFFHDVALETDGKSLFFVVCKSFLGAAVLFFDLVLAFN
jgi:hypothetical protein